MRACSDHSSLRGTVLKRELGNHNMNYKQYKLILAVTNAFYQQQRRQMCLCGHGLICAQVHKQVHQHTL